MQTFFSNFATMTPANFSLKILIVNKNDGYYREIYKLHEI